MAQCKHHEVCGRKAAFEDGCCILHTGVSEKDGEAFEKVFETHRAKRGDNFSWMVFPSGHARFSEITFEGNADFSKTTFEGGVLFDETTFEGDVTFVNATFGGRASFAKTTFEGDALFVGTEFEREAVFVEAEFGGDASFRDATFKGRVAFRQATFGGRGLFEGKESFHAADGFPAEADFRDVQLDPLDALRSEVPI